jgi:hypothetical protein
MDESTKALLSMFIPAMDKHMQMLGLPFYLPKKWPDDVKPCSKILFTRTAALGPRIGAAHIVGFSLTVFKQLTAALLASSTLNMAPGVVWTNAHLQLQGAVAQAQTLGLPADLLQEIAALTNMQQPTPNPALMQQFSQNMDNLLKRILASLSRSGQPLPLREVEDRTTSYFGRNFKKGWP